jgi:hypothetical protein
LEYKLQTALLADGVNRNGGTNRRAGAAPLLHVRIIKRVGVRIPVDSAAEKCGLVWVLVQLSDAVVTASFAGEVNDGLPVRVRIGQAVARMKADCARFRAENAHDIEGREEQAGHDFWFTRNHHGCGFWDEDWAEAGDRLTEACNGHPEVNLYVGDDGLIYC